MSELVWFYLKKSLSLCSFLISFFISASNFSFIACVGEFSNFT